jgi:carbonic anhydrase
MVANLPKFVRIPSACVFGCDDCRLPPAEHIDLGVLGSGHVVANGAHRMPAKLHASWLLGVHGKE